MLGYAEITLLCMHGLDSYIPWTVPDVPCLMWLIFDGIIMHMKIRCAWGRWRLIRVTLFAEANRTKDQHTRRSAGDSAA